MRFGFLLALVAAIPLYAHPPVSVVFDSRGNAYYSDLEQVWQVARNGTQRVVVPHVHTHELFIDAQDNLFGEHLWYEGEKTDRWGHYVWRRDARGTITKVIPNTEGFLTDYSFVRDRTGSMYFAKGNSVVRRTPAGRNDILASGQFRDIRWMHVTPDGTLYLIDAGDVVRITPDKRVTRIARGLAKTSLLRMHIALRHALQGIWTDRAGNVYVADSANARVLRILPNGSTRVVAESKFGWSPSGGAFDRAGALWILEFSPTNRVRLRRTTP
jgi:DNA-binding beta-propeller fold protein YncE